MTARMQYLTAGEREAIGELAEARAEVARLENELQAARARVETARGKLAALTTQTIDATSEPMQEFLSSTAMGYLHDAELSEAARAALGAAPSRQQGFGTTYIVRASRPVFAEILARLEETQAALRLQGARQHKNDIGNLGASIKRIRERLGQGNQ